MAFSKGILYPTLIYTKKLQMKWILPLWEWSIILYDLG